MWAVWDVTSRIGVSPIPLLGVYFDYSDTVFSWDPRRHPGVRGLVALTIDDGLCRSGRDRAMIKEVQDLLRRYDAKATFMLCSDYVKGFEDEARSLLEDGHEFGNHCPCDREYASLPQGEFEEKLLETGRALEALLGGRRVRWFRAPQARYTSAMREVVTKHGMRSALGDTYCDDWAAEDPGWIASTMLRQVGSGSIIINHFPERGFREHIFEALERILEGLKERGLRAVTLSALADAAERPGAAASSAEGAADEPRQTAGEASR